MGPEQFSYARNRALYCRADFTLEKEPECAYALVCGLGYHVFSINGIRQGDAVLEPGFTAFDKRVQYVMHDITPSLRMGENTLGIVLGEGWYNNRHEVFERFDFLKPLTWLGLPKLSDNMDPEDARALRSYLYQMQEQLQYVLTNLDTENMSDTLRSKLQGL